MGPHHSQSAEPQTDWYALILGLLLPFGVGVVISNDSKVTLYAAWACIAVRLAWTAYRARKKSKWSPWIKTVLACILILVFSFSALYNIREKLRPSFTLITPGVLLNGKTRSRKSFICHPYGRPSQAMRSETKPWRSPAPPQLSTVSCQLSASFGERRTPSGQRRTVAARPPVPPATRSSHCAGQRGVPELASYDATSCLAPLTGS
jgi:hypothetical protein